MIKVTFKNGKEVEYTDKIIPLLVADQEVVMIEDMDTGEVLYRTE